MSKENSLKNLYSVWGSKPLDHMFNNESFQFYADLSCEGITSDEYMEYARKKNVYPTGTKFKTKDGKTWEIVKFDKYFDSYNCVTRNKKTGQLEFKDFETKKLEGVEFI